MTELAALLELLRQTVDDPKIFNLEGMDNRESFREELLKAWEVLFAK